MEVKEMAKSAVYVLLIFPLPTVTIYFHFARILNLYQAIAPKVNRMLDIFYIMIVTAGLWYSLTLSLKYIGAAKDCRSANCIVGMKRKQVMEL